ncbi:MULTISPECIES: hypothetical protein [unclassified Acinetobacter]|uniref:hypothetical protein n=1 Tax=unclassified Acinetobacter TaxID=196816 RepID=UPI00293446A5|nr:MULTISPECIES: hypothetical protein [unclassified Acinetobacter]WOE31962.1 hypothetical protein QSG84_01675 [Acinetobacter sp. SAAs470]WOE37430.1 hypothetical protein QSG86_10720 [Acinetobacter sp. SAAs474]
MTTYSLAEYKKLVKNTRRFKRRVTVSGQKTLNEFEEKLARELKTLNIEFEREFKFHQTRKWRADFYLIGKMILVEVEGGIWLGGKGRHTSGKGYLGDMEKYNAAQELGYSVIRFSTAQVKSGMAIGQIEKMVNDA